MKLMIGCPVLHRDWILERWFDHVEAAAEKAGVTDFTYIFVGDPEHDPKTFEIIKRRTRPGGTYTSPVPDGRSSDQREWNRRRFQRMVELRNRLLSGVRISGPDAFLSLDSDILLHEDAIAALLSNFDPAGAVGGKCYLSKVGTKAPSWGKLSRAGKLQRVDSVGTFPVDVLMAIKLMGPDAYAVDYKFDTEGEDTGWSKNARTAGVRLRWVGAPASKHVWGPDYLDKVDPRVGW